jgi:hypothetical protein
LLLLCAPHAPAQTTAPADPTWRLLFDSIYSLQEGQTLKYLPPPFIPQRADFWTIEFAARSASHPEPPNCFDFILFNGQLRMRSATFSEDQTLSTLLTDLFGLPFYGYDASPQLLSMPLPGDWIIRYGAQNDLATMDQLSSALSRIRQKNVRIERKTLPLDVIVLSGTWKPSAIPGYIPGVHLYIGKLDAPGKHDPPQTVAFRDMVTTVERHLYVRMIDESKGAPASVQVIYHNSFVVPISPQRPVAPETDERMQSVLKAISDQTGLTCTREKRQREVWQFIAE